uniref:Ribosomal protein S1 n=1 Tax=Schizocladia ischiensis TaxID=196139 RepID=A0A7S6ZPC0_9STRA|nr:ribosomal protein S1 [Schizocladia ischiensis]QOW07579.1 ribosomal protein S1 [Schizocladia ischiensis]
MKNLIQTSTFEFNKFAKLLAKYNYKVKKYDILAGIVIGLEENYALVDLGLTRVALLPRTEIFIKPTLKFTQVININFTGEFMILNINPLNNQIVVSMNKVHILRRWERIKQMDFLNMIIYGRLKESLPKGRIIAFEGLKLFAPNSHIPKYYRRKKQKDIFLPMKFLELKESIHTVSISLKLAFLRKQHSVFKTGSIYIGCITSITYFGIFLNIFGVKCLLHISELSNRKISKIDLFFSIGDELRVKIIYKNVEEGRIAASIKRL